MAVLALKSIQETDGVRKPAYDDHSKVRFQYFEIAPVAVAGDANTTIDLCELPPGPVRVLPWMSRIKTSAFGSSRTLDIGHRAYQVKDPVAGVYTEEAENETAFVAAKDVSSAVANDAWSATVLKYDIYSKAGVMIFAKVEGGTIPVAATLSGFVAYLYE
jgi:hypothetical protein